MSLRRILWATLTVALAASSAQAQRELKDIPDPDPEVERKSFQLAEGFEVNLFAGDPLLAKPIQMNFDAQGRLWVASSEVYPQIAPGQKANDKVLILEDRDGDGKADVTTVFADGLLIPTGVEPGDGGAYIANSTELLHLKDTDGDGKADRKRIVLSGFGTEDTHHILHTLRWGWEGNLYMNQSIYIHSHLETPRGVKRLNGGGIWRFRPETMDLDVFMRGLVNTWGHHYDPWGQSFATDGAGGEGINYVLPGAYYFTAVDAVRILKGLNPGSPKHCGLEVVGGRHLPESWEGNLLTNDFRGNRVCRFVISDDGAGYASREQAELIKTKHQAFRPIDIKMGPDGAIYIADWYNPIIQHGEVDFRDPRRDHTHGRIWRVTAKGRPAVERPKLVGASVESLLDALKSPESWTRHFAKRVLKERGATAVVAPLVAWTSALDANDLNYEHNLLEALWTYQTVNVVEPELLGKLLAAKDARVRAAAVRVVHEWRDRLSDPVTLLAPRVADDHPRVRLEAVRVLAEIPELRSAELALSALDRPMDRFLDYALWLTARDLQKVWLPAAQAGKFDDGGKPSRLIFAFEAVGSPSVVAPLVESLKSGKFNKDAQERALVLIANLGGPAELGMILDQAIVATTDPKRTAVLLDALAQAYRSRKAVPSGDLARISKLLDGGEASSKIAAARVAGIWKVEALRTRLAALAESSQTGAEVREAALDGLVALGGPASVQELIKLADPRNPASLRVASVAGLANLDPDAAAQAAVKILPTLTYFDPTAIFAAFVERQAAADALAKALTAVDLPADVAKLGLRAATTSGKPNIRLIDALTKSGKLESKARAWSAAERDSLLGDIARKGNAARGELVFRRASNQCLKCHAIAGAGGQVGPGLESIGGSAQPDYLLDSILEPNKQVKENYHSTVVATRDGKVLNGLKLRQTDSELILRDSEDREISIPLNMVEEQKMGGSLMPAGLADNLTRGELTDLIRFMSELGKVGPYSVGKGQIARRWQVLETSKTLSTQIHGKGMDATLNDPSLRWSPAYSTVSGVLPAIDVPTIDGVFGIPSRGVARTGIDVSTGGKVRLKVALADRLTIWIDGNRVDPKDSIDLNLAPGQHWVAISFNREGETAVDAIQLELVEVAGSSARAQVLLGK